MTLHQDFSNNLHYIVPGESLCGNSGWMKFLMNRKWLALMDIRNMPAARMQQAYFLNR